MKDYKDDNRDLFNEADAPEGPPLRDESMPLPLDFGMAKKEGQPESGPRKSRSAPRAKTPEIPPSAIASAAAVVPEKKESAPGRAPEGAVQEKFSPRPVVEKSPEKPKSVSFPEGKTLVSATSAGVQLQHPEVFKTIESRAASADAPPRREAPAQKPSRPAHIQHASRESNPPSHHPKDDSHLKPRRPHVPEKFSSENATAGQVLQEARVRSKFGVSQAAIATKIKEDFIDAIERDDFADLPAPVYVNAYIRALCALYRIEEAPVLKLLEKVKGSELEYTVPEEILHEVEKGKQINVEQAVKVRKIVFLSLAAAAIVITALVLAVNFLYLKNSRSKQGAAGAVPAPSSFQSDKALSDEMEKKLVSPQTITITELQVPDTGSR